MLLTPPSVTTCHTFSDSLPFERDVLYGRPLYILLSFLFLYMTVLWSNNEVSLMLSFKAEFKSDGYVDVSKDEFSRS